MSHMRLEKGIEIGDPGAVYEFEIKIQKLHDVDMTDEELERESQTAIRDFARELKNRYSWIGKIYQTGRSGGWLAVQDIDGGGTWSKIQAIIRLVDKAQEKFVKYIEKKYAC